MDVHSSLNQLSDEALLAVVRRLAGDERRATAQLIASLAELDARRLYLGQGCSSLFTYCTQVLHLSEHAAYGRIEAARAARQFPLILDMLSEGALTLTAIGLLARHLTPQNHVGVLNSARHRRKTEVEEVVARLHPQRDVVTIVRKLPDIRKSSAPRSEQPTTSAAAIASPAPPLAKPPEVKPLTPERYEVQFTVSRQTYEKLRRAQDLLRHTVPNGDPAAIFDRALTLLLRQVSRTQLGATDRPRAPGAAGKPSRHVPAAVKRLVWKRDAGRCAFVGAAGRCVESGFLQFHHVVPFAAGGETIVENLELRCRPHNAYEAEQDFGARRPPLEREHRKAF